MSSEILLHVIETIINDFFKYYYKNNINTFQRLISWLFIKGLSKLVFSWLLSSRFARPNPHLKVPLVKIRKKLVFGAELPCYFAAITRLTYIESNHAVNTWVWCRVRHRRHRLSPWKSILGQECRLERVGRSSLPWGPTDSSFQSEVLPMTEDRRPPPPLTSPAP